MKWTFRAWLAGWRGKRARASGYRFTDLVSAALVGLVVGVPSSASAQSVPIKASIQTTVTATNNGADAPSGQQQEDLLFALQPRVTMSRRGSGLNLIADVAADMVAAANKTRRSRILPYARLEADATLVDRLLYLDSSADVRQVESDPFASRVDRGSTDNTRTAASGHLAPRVSYEITPRVSLTARDDNAWTRYSGDSASDARTRRSTVRLGAKPQPFGASVEWTRQNVSYVNAPGDDWTLSSLSAGLSWALGGEWVLGAAAGSERNESPVTRSTGRSYGLRLFWSPGTRTELASSVDRRFFGTGWNVSARHRTPTASVMFRIYRDPIPPGGGSLGSVSSGGLAAFLDAILTTRHPDAAERGELVDNLIANRGLQSSLPAAINSGTDYAQLSSGSEVTWVLLGTRNTLSLSLYQLKLSQLAQADGTIVSVGTPVSDNKQFGGGVVFNRRLAPDTSFDASARWSRIAGLALRTGDVTREANYRLTGVRNLSSRTDLSLGLQFRRVDTNVTALNSFDETTAFVGLAHRF